MDNNIIIVDNFEIVILSSNNISYYEVRFNFTSFTSLLNAFLNMFVRTNKRVSKFIIRELLNISLFISQRFIDFFLLCIHY